MFDCNPLQPASFLKPDESRAFFLLCFAKRSFSKIEQKK